MHTPHLLALAACLRAVDTDSDVPDDSDSSTDTDTDPAPPEPWWFPAVSDGDLHFARACGAVDPATWAYRLHVVGWFEGTATFGAAPNVVLTADGVDGFLVELDGEGLLQRVVSLGGPGDQRALDCDGAYGTFVTGTFGGTLEASGVDVPLVATTDRDAFVYEELAPNPEYGTPGGPSLTHLVAGRTDDLGVACVMFGCRVFGTFEDTITVWPGRPEAWTATSRGGKDAFYGRPSAPLLVQGPGTEVIRQITSFAGDMPPTPHVTGNWLVGSVGAGAEVVVGDVVTPVPEVRGGTDALTVQIGYWLDEATGPASVEVRGSEGDDVAGGVSFASNLETAGTFGAGVEAASGTFGEFTVPSHGGADVFLAAEAGWGGEHLALRAFGSGGDDTLTDVAFKHGYPRIPPPPFAGGAAVGTFAGETFEAWGVPAATSYCDEPSTWLLTFDAYLAPTWLGSGCGVNVTQADFADDGSAFLVVNHGDDAYLQLPTRLVQPRNPMGGHGAFVASWPAD